MDKRMEKNRKIICFYVEPVCWVSNESETTEEMAAVTAANSEGVKTREGETPSPQLFTNYVADSITFEDNVCVETETESLLKNLLQSEHKTTQIL